MGWIQILLRIIYTLTICSAEQGSMFKAISGFLRDTAELYEGEPSDAKRILPEYDFIIIGAGTAGCVLSNRLTEVDKFQVLLIEAGGSELMFMDIPVLATLLQFTEANWDYHTEPQVINRPKAYEDVVITPNIFENPESDTQSEDKSSQKRKMIQLMTMMIN